MRFAARFMAPPALTAMVVVASLLLSCSGAAASAAEASTPCAALMQVAVPNTRITLAREYPAGVNPVPEPPETIGRLTGVLAASVCRVVGTIAPTPDSAIGFEVWMPVRGWNGKLDGVGNGGAGGYINYEEMQPGLRRGYATASTDTGHRGSPFDGSWMQGHPALVLDFAQRSQHLTAEVSKAIVQAYYRQTLAHAYFTGCSNAGEEGLSEAQRYPLDYDGIVAGAPTVNPTHMWPGDLYAAWVVRADPESLIKKLPALSAAVYAQCDAADGVQDGVIDDPRQCHFDPASLQCPSGTDAPTCLTSTQVQWVRKLYHGLDDPSSGKPFWPGLIVGSEANWADHLRPMPVKLTRGYFQYLVYANPAWSYADVAFDFESARTLADLREADAAFGPVLDALNPDLRPFRDRGGKLLLYHGWADDSTSPQGTLDYYANVLAATGEGSETRAAGAGNRFVRLFMVPGMGHCTGGPGFDSFDPLTALETWVEQGKVPEQIVAAHRTEGKAVRTRPLCPFPERAAYRKTGSIDEASSYVCRVPAQHR